MNRDKVTVYVIVLIVVSVSVYKAYDNYKIRDTNIVEFSLDCIDNDYEEVHSEQKFTLNLFDHIMVNRSHKRLIWISQPHVYRSSTDYAVSVASYKNPLFGGTARYYILKRSGDFFYFEVNGREYSVSVHDARDANLDCYIVDNWIIGKGL